MAKKNRVSPMLRRIVSGFFTKPATTLYPFEQRAMSDNFRGQPIFDNKLCIGCGLCSKECPSKAIEMVTVHEKRYPQFRLDKCIFCYSCADSCPRKAIKSSVVYELATTDKTALVMKPKRAIVCQA